MQNAPADTMTVPKFLGGGQIDFQQKPVPAPRSGELLIQVKANALCGSELPQFRNGSLPTPGHEAAGIVAAAGPDTHTAVGTPGVIFLMDFCGECRSCRIGLTNQCLQKRADMGFTHDGGYGVYELIHENIFFPVPAELPLTEATMLLDVLGTTSHAIRRAQMVHQDGIRSVVVSGSGPVGLGALAAAKIMLGRDVPVFVTDLSAYRLDLAGRLGGIPVSIIDTSLSDVLRQHEMSAVDVAIDTSGKTAGRRTAFDALDKRGVFVCVGHGEGLNLTVSPDMIAPERAVLGSEYFTYAELPASLKMLQSNFDYCKQIITHRYPVHAIQQAFETFFAGSTGKVIIEQ
jgi:threonine 3-dehydrogenase